MSEARDKVKSHVSGLMQCYKLKKVSWEIAELILSVKELAIVDREAELPTIPDPPIYSDKPYSDIEKQAFRVGILTYRNSVLKAGWVKEVK